MQYLDKMEVLSLIREFLSECGGETHDAGAVENAFGKLANKLTQPEIDRLKVELPGWPFHRPTDPE